VLPLRQVNSKPQEKRVAEATLKVILFRYAAFRCASPFRFGGFQPIDSQMAGLTGRGRTVMVLRLTKAPCTFTCPYLNIFQMISSTQVATHWLTKRSCLVRASRSEQLGPW